MWLKFQTGQGEEGGGSGTAEKFFYTTIVVPLFFGVSFWANHAELDPGLLTAVG